jgi:hypothetical protein
MAYDHKKSLRTLTDEQFTDGTTVDASRIDNALDESLEHFNEVPQGDVSTRFTKTQYIFGYQPAPYTGTPNTAAGTVPPGGSSLETFTGTIEAPTWPWNFITNTPETTAEVDDTVPTYGVRGTPVGGFDNKWRIKGTNYHPLGGAGAAPTNEGKWAKFDWEGDWLSGQGGAAAVAWRNTENAYQVAWTHSWIFPSPVILDSVCALLRADITKVNDAGTTFGYYDAPFEFSYPAGPLTLLYQTQGVSIHISVDNEFSKEDRSLNDVEYAFSNRRLDGYTVNDIPMDQTAYADMLPNSPDYNAGAGDGLYGRLIRHTDLNIPIRANARLRMSIVLPWMVAASTGTDDTTSQGLRRNTAQYKFPLWTVAGSGPMGGEPMFGFSLNGSLTVLEQVTT